MEKMGHIQMTFPFPNRFRGRARPKTGMNKLEAKYAERLATLKIAGQVLWYGYEAIKLRLADKTFYTPDFAVMLADGSLEFHEAKGFWEDDARVKIKVAAETFPAVFRAYRADKVMGWVEEDFSKTNE